MSETRSSVGSYREENDAGGLHGVFWRKYNPAVVNPAVEIRIWWAAHGEVPFKEVILQKEGNIQLVKYHRVSKRDLML